MSGPCFSASVGDHPLRPPTRRSLGRPLPYQLADGTQAPPRAVCTFRHGFLSAMTAWGISSPFELLSPSLGQVTNVLLTRSPLRYILLHTSVRLACIKHAASVHPEPGSNSPHKLTYARLCVVLISLAGLDKFRFSSHSSVVKVLSKGCGFYQPHSWLSRDVIADAKFRHRLVRLDKLAIIVSDARRPLWLSPICHGRLGRSFRVDYYIPELFWVSRKSRKEFTLCSSGVFTGLSPIRSQRTSTALYHLSCW